MGAWVWPATENKYSEAKVSLATLWNKSNLKMADTVQNDSELGRTPRRIERADTGLSEMPSTISTKSKRRRSLRLGDSLLASRTRSPEGRPSSTNTDVVMDNKKKKKTNAPPPGSHKVTFTVTVAKAIPTGM